MNVTKNRKGRLGLFLLLLLLGGTVALAAAGAALASPTVLHVKASATGANNGTSWTDAYTSLQSALGAASSGQQIWVAAGTYSPGVSRAATFTLKNGVAVYGGFPAAGGEWTARDPGVNVTTLEGGGNGTGSDYGTYHLVTAPAGTDASTVLDGFTVKGANTYVSSNTKGGGLLVYGSPTLANLVVRFNYSCLCGAGMYIEGGSPTLTSITFKDNNATWYGAGLAIRNGSPTMRDITFRDNRVGSGLYGGGGMHVAGGHTTLTGALFAGNIALSGGGLGLASVVPGGGAGTSYPDTSLALTNVVFAANTSHSGGGGAGMNAAGGTATLTNVDFVANGGTGGAGLRLGSSDSLGANNATVTVRNSIFWGNTISGSPKQIVVTGGSLTVADSDVQGGWTGTGNIDSFPFINSGDPGLLTDVDWDGLDNVFGTVDDGIRLEVGSPAVDTGDGAALAAGVTTDLLGTPRFQDGDGDGTPTVDMGALEARPPVTDDVIYVNGAATGANDGTSWADAFTDLQAGLALAAPGDSTQIWVAAGTYKPTIGTDRIATFLLKDGVTVYGGFPASGDPVFADRNPATYITTLSGDLKGDDAGNFANRGDNVCHVVSAFSWVDNTAVLDGVTIRGGNANGSPRSDSDCFGGGMYNKNGAPRLIDVTLCDNRASGRGGGMFTIAGAPALAGVTFAGNYGANAGGGLQVDSGSLALTDVAFEGNTSDGVGGGMCVANPDDVPAVADVTLSGATFTGNTAQWGGGYAASAGNISMHGATLTGNHAGYMGGGAYVGDYNLLNSYVGDMDLLDVDFRGNSASNTPSSGYEAGGAMVIFDATPTLTNVVFSGNDADTYGGAIYVLTFYIADGPTLINTTFSGNSAASGGAISADYGKATIRNSILWGDGGGEVTGAVTVSRSIVQGGHAGTGNSSADPLFASPISPAAAPTTAGDLRLRATSPAIDAGDTSLVPAGVTTDLDGCPRVRGSAVDMGAYERGDTLAPTTSASGTDALWHNQPVTLTFTATDGAAGSGVARTEYWVDSGIWAPGTSVTIGAPSGGANDGLHTVAYRSIDRYGNVENTNLCSVRIDTVAPSASDDHDGLWHRSFTLHLGGADARSGVDHLSYSIDGRPEQTVAAGACQLLLRTWKRGGNSGVHTVAYRAVDRAGNEAAGSCEVLLDGRAPVTKDDAPRDGSGNPLPRTGPVVVHLTATDQPGLSAVAATFWRLDGGAWQQGTSVPVPADGVTHWISYYSVDHAGNQENCRWSAVITLAPRVAKHAVGMRLLR